MKTSQAILFAIALHLLTSLVAFNVFDKTVQLSWLMILLTSVWVAEDSARVQLRRYRSGMACSPLGLFFCCSLLWIIAFPWYLSMRQKIQTGTAVLKEEVSNAVA